MATAMVLMAGRCIVDFDSDVREAILFWCVCVENLSYGLDAEEEERYGRHLYLREGPAHFRLSRGCPHSN